MMQRFLKRAACLSMAFAMVLGFVLPGIGGELRPFDLPSQRAPNAAPLAREDGQQKVDESVYKDFESKVKTLNPGPEAKKELIKSFTQKMDQAVKESKLIEAKYYRRLLEILQK